MFDNRFTLRHGLLTGVAAVALVLAAPAAAQDVARDYDLPAQALGRSLAEVSKLAGREVMVSSRLVRGKTAPALKGRYTADHAYALLLAGQGLKVTPVGAVLVLQAASPAAALGKTKPAAVEALSEIVVTGTRIRGAAPVGSNLISITPRDIEASGYASTQEVLQALPQNYGGGASEGSASLSARNGALFNGSFGSGVNLRGLGNSSTLVLMNGDRLALGGIAGSFADVSLIPSTAIDHVEVLADGASALYGSDAVAGVINIVMRDRLEGGETRLRYGAADGDLSEIQAAQAFGRTWDRGHVTLAYEYLKRGSLAAEDRDYAREDLRPFGGADHRSLFAAPGTIIAGGQTYAIPAGQNGVGLRPSQLTAGTTHLRDARLGSDILPRQTRQSLYLSGGVDLNAKTTLSAHLLGADRRYDMRKVSLWSTAVAVPFTNPFYLDPAGALQPVRVRYRFADDLGPERHVGHVQAINGGADLTRRLGDWSATLSADYGREEEVYSSQNLVNTYRLALALADTNPATTYNLFGDPGSTNTGTIESIRGWGASLGAYTVWTAGLKGDGPLLDLPAGPLKLAVGVEHRSERYQSGSRVYQTTATPSTFTDVFPGARHIDAAYAELRAPLVGQDHHAPLIKRLDVSVAGRIERYSDLGTTSNPKVGLDWEVGGGLTLKASYGTSFRAPSFQDQRQGPGLVQYFPYTVNDPNSPTGRTNVLFLLGNSSDIGPEQAKTWTTSVEWRPPMLANARLVVGYFHVRYEGRIGAPNADALNMLINRRLYQSQLNETPTAADIASYYASPYLSNPLGLAAGDIMVIANARTQNLSSLTQDGVDVDVSYQRPIADGDLRLGLGGSYTFRVDKQFTAGAPSSNVVDTVGNPLRLRLRGQAGWSSGPFDLAASVNHTGDYLNQTVTPGRPVSSWTTVDLSLAYRFLDQTGSLKGLRLALSASNVFDKDPPFVESITPSSAIGFDTDNASAIGRVVALTVTKPW